MKQIFAFLFCIVFLCSAQSSTAQNIDSLVASANEAYKSGQFVKSSMLLELAINAGCRDPKVLYNASCCFALSGRKEKAWKYLEQTAELGFNQAEHMEKDTDLVSLHSDPRWKKLVEKIKPNEKNEKIQANLDAITNDICNISAHAYQYWIRPISMEGGGQSYIGYQLTEKLRSNDNAVYSASVISPGELSITGTSSLIKGAIIGRLNDEGRIFKWEYSGAFEKMKK
jgi:hypothetical protein